MKFSEKKNIKLFILFSLLVVIIIALFIFMLIKVLSYDRTIYNISIGSFMYDEDNEYIKVENEATLQQKMNKHYYLKVSSSKYKETIKDMGEDVVSYNTKKKSLNIYGENYEVLKTGEVNHNTKIVENVNMKKSSLYKLDDRKYLLVGKNIITEENDVKTSNYLIINIDKDGKAFLMNNEINIKLLNNVIITSGIYKFDVANEKLIINGKEIDLKKIDGSTNLYKEKELEEEEEEKEDKDTTNNNSNNNSSSKSNNSTTTNVSSNSSSSSNITVNKSISITSLKSYVSYIELGYLVIDPKNEYTSVYLVISNDNMDDKTITLNKNSTTQRIRNLTPNSEYTVTVGYTRKTEEDTIVSETLNTFKVKTNKNKSSLTISKITSKQVYFNLKYDSNYVYDEAKVNVYSDGVIIGSVNADKSQAISSSGYTGVVNFTENLGSEIIIKLENTTYNGEEVNSNLYAKFINR